MSSNFNSKKGIYPAHKALCAGFIGILITILILVAMITIGTSVVSLVIAQHRLSSDVLKSTQAYFAAEAGIEDALLKLSNNPEWVKEFGTSYLLEAGDATTTITVSSIVGGSRNIISEGDMKNRVRKMEVAYEVATEKVSFHYGAQVDEGGMILYNNSEIQGNIFSNGSIILSGAAGDKGIVTGGVIVASTSTTYGNNEIKGLQIGADACTHSCDTCTIAGKLSLTGGTAVDCDATGGTVSSEAVSKKTLPITQEQINKWKTEASSSDEIWTGNYDIGGKEIHSFGPRKIEGSLTIGIKGVLIMEGTIWVTGTTTIKNNATVELKPSAYGSRSGVLISDGSIIIENGAILQGSGQEGSYLMLLSTSDSQSEDNPAIHVMNNALGAILYTTRGLISLENNMEVREVTGYKILLKPNSVIKYETGLIDTLFTAGPGGSWQVTGWREVK